MLTNTMHYILKTAASKQMQKIIIDILKIGKKKKKTDQTQSATDEF